MKTKKKDLFFDLAIEDVVLSYSKRGMDVLKDYIPTNFIEIVSERIMHLSRKNVFITTGFFVEGFAETDGPVGTYFLTKAIQKLGFKPIIITDEYCRGFFEGIAYIDIIYVSFNEPNFDTYFDGLLEMYKPVSLISVERCGRNKKGAYCNMRGVNISEFTAPIDELFDKAFLKDIYTVGIGDGGNEIGMGNLYDIIERKLDISAATTKVNDLIVSTVSNWGAYALIAYLQMKSGLSMLPNFSEVQGYIKRIVDIGSIDGVTKKRSYTVDGYALKYDKEILEKLHKILEDNISNNFRMSNDYEKQSLSQFSIGMRVVNVINKIITKESLRRIKVLDIGCGPGNLTYALYSTLIKKSPNLDISAIDFDAEAISKAQKKYEDINFCKANMYQLPEKFSEQFDYVFSNETLHWMPEYFVKENHTNSIVYYFLGDKERKNYSNFALRCYKKSFANIHKALKRNGVAVLQFGMHGQLMPIYELINNIFNEKLSTHMARYFLPLYYPTGKEIGSICLEEGFEVICTDKVTRSLSETNTTEIISFLKGFMVKSLSNCLDNENINLFFDEMRINISKRDIEAFRNRQWKHVILVLRKR